MYAFAREYFYKTYTCLMWEHFYKNYMPIMWEYFYKNYMPNGVNLYASLGSIMLQAIQL